MHTYPAAGAYTVNEMVSNTNGTNSMLATINVLTASAQKITPTITWSNPVDIIYGTPLSNAQLDASASVPGTFVYTPPPGTILNPGTQTLNTTFTPNDSTIYTTASATVKIKVTAQNSNWYPYPGNLYPYKGLAPLWVPTGLTVI